MKPFGKRREAILHTTHFPSTILIGWKFISIVLVLLQTYLHNIFKSLPHSRKKTNIYNIRH